MCLKNLYQFQIRLSTDDYFLLSCIILVDKDNMQVRDSIYIWVLIVIDKRMYNAPRIPCNWHATGNITVIFMALSTWIANLVVNIHYRVLKQLVLLIFLSQAIFLPIIFWNSMLICTWCSQEITQSVHDLYLS